MDFVTTLILRPDLVKMFRETVESVWVARCREVDARLSKWKKCSLDQQQRLQQVLFPQGVLYHQKTGYRTRTTCLFFSMLEGNFEDKTHLVALTGIEPVSQP